MIVADTDGREYNLVCTILGDQIGHSGPVTSWISEEG